MLALAALLALPGTASAAGPLEGALPRDGIGLAVWGGGTAGDLVAAAGNAGCTARSVWVTQQGALVGYIAGAPAFVNAAWVAATPSSLPADTPVIVVCGTQAAAQAPSPSNAPPSSTPAPSAPRPASGSGAAGLPAGWPATLEVGIADGPGGAGARASEGFGFRYQYLSAGVNTGSGWATWNPDGRYVSMYIEDSVRAGIVPVFSYYMIRDSLPGRNMGEADGVSANVTNAATMRAYFEDLRLFFERAGSTGSLVVLQVEPDMWGYLQQRSRGNEATTVSVQVAGTGLAELAGLPDNLAGFAQAIVRLRDRHAPNVALGYSISTWGTGVDIGLAKPSDTEVDRLAGVAAGFYRSLGARFDVAFAEFSDRDAGFKQHIYGDGGASWWNDGDFARFARFLGGFHQATSRPIVLWQIPLGNTKMRAMNNTWNHFQDNRVEWLLDDPSGRNLVRYADAGVVALLFGRGADGATCACDAARDGVTDPAPINGNDRASLTADDDGGYFKERVREYYRAGPLSLR